MSTFVKKATSAVLTSAIVLTTAGSTVGVSAALMGNIDAANTLAKNGVIVDQSSNPSAYRLADTIQRKEALKVMIRLSNLTVNEGACTSPFADINDTDWACKYAVAALNAGYIAANTNFRPDDNVSKIESLKMVMKARNISKDANTADWRAAYVKAAVAKGIAEEFSDYNTAATRGTMFIWAAEAINIEQNNDSNTDDSDLGSVIGDILGGGDEETTTQEETTSEETTTQEETTTDSNASDELVISLNPETPSDGLAPAGVARVPLLKFDVKAGSQDVTLNKYTLKFIGLGDYKKLEDVSIYNENGEKISKTKNFTELEREISFDKNIVVEAGKTMTLTVVGKIVDNGADNATYGVKLVDLQASSDVKGDELVGALLVPAVFSNMASLELTDDTASESITVGEEVKLAGFSLEEKVDDKDALLKSVTMTVSGSVDTDDIINLKLLADGKVIADNLTINSDDDIVIPLDFTIPEGDKVDFELKGTLAGSVGDEIEIVFESPIADNIYAVDAENKMNITVTADSLDIAEAQTIEGAEINVSFDKSDIDEAKPDAEKVEVGTLKVIADSADYTVNKLEVTVTRTNNAETISNIIKDLEINGSSYDTVSGDTATGTTTTATYVFEDIDLPKGEKDLKITFDVEDNTTLNGTDLEFDVKFIEIEDNEQDITYTSNLNDILSSNSFNTKTISIETATFAINGVDVNERELVLGNGIETVVYKAKINIGDSDSVSVKDFKLENASTLSNSADLKDIIDSATLNIGGQTFDGDINSSDIKFDGIDAVISAGADNVEVLITVVLKDSDKIENGNELKLTAVLDNNDVEDSAGDDLVVANIDGDNINSHPVVTKLLDKGTFSIVIKNDPDTDDNLENTVLAGSSNVTLAEIELEAEYEDTKVKEIAFDFGYGDYSNTLTNVKLVNVDNGSTIVDGGIVTLDNANHTIVTFKNDFIVSDTDNLIHAEVVSDLNKITGEGDETSAIAGNIKLEKIIADKTDIKGVQSNDELLSSDLSVVNDGESITIVPTILRFAVIETLNNGQAKVKITADSGDNTVGSNDQVPEVKLNKLTFAELGNNDDGYTLYKDGDAANQITSSTGSSVEFTFSGSSVDNTFDTDQTYVIIPKGTVDKTYSLVLSGDVSEYDVQDSDDVIVTSGLKTTLSSDISVGSKTY